MANTPSGDSSVVSHNQLASAREVGAMVYCNFDSPSLYVVMEDLAALKATDPIGVYFPTTTTFKRDPQASPKVGGGNMQWCGHATSLNDHSITWNGPMSRYSSDPNYDTPIVWVDGDM